MLKNKLMLLTILFRPISIAAWQTIAPRARRAGLLIALIALGICLAWLPLPLAATGLLGALAIVIILLRPVWGLVGLILLIPFSPLVSLRIGGVQVGGMEALLGLILVAWLLRMAARREIVIPHPPLLLPWLLWLGVILASWTVALSLGDALAETLKWLEMLALYLFIAANVERRHLPWLVGAMLLAGMAQAALGLYQFLFRVGPESFLLFGGRFLRAYGTFRQPNPYAGYLGLVLPIAYSLVLGGLGAGGWKLEGSGRRLAVGGLLTANGSQPPAPSPQPPAITYHVSRITFYVSRFPRRGPMGTLYASLSFGLMLAALYASQSRGAWIGFVAAVVVVSLVRGGRTALLFVLAIAVVAALGATGTFQILPQSIPQRFGDALTALNIPDIATAEVTDANFATIERLAHWGAALAMWRDHLWLGVGFGNYAAVYPAYAIGRWLDPLGHAHNYYLNVAAETGLVGLLAYGLFWLSAFRLGWQALRRSTGFQRAVAAGGLGILVHLSLHNMVDNLFVQGMYLQVGIVLGLLCLIYRARIDKPDRRV
jgi:putative inorganic carbon (HCO3(-)) transporter